MPLADLIRPGLDQSFVPNGHTDDPEIPRVRSAVDYIARRPAIDWLPYPERAALGVYTLTERVQRASTWIEAHEPARPVRLRSGRLPVSHLVGHLGEHHGRRAEDGLTARLTLLFAAGSLKHVPYLQTSGPLCTDHRSDKFGNNRPVVC